MDERAHLRAPAALAAIMERTAALGFSMPSEPRTGAMLRVLCAGKPGGRLLELGTGTGLATAWMLDGMDPSARLTSVDVDPAVQAVARQYFGDDVRLDIVTEDAATFVSRQAPRSFDLIFADAMPGKYEILEETLALLRPEAFYIVDDMLPQDNWPAGHAPRVPRLVETLSGRTDLRMVSMAWSSGLVVATRLH
jgi:predicted O-methyltransferase YrrM